MAARLCSLASLMEKVWQPARIIGGEDGLGHLPRVLGQVEERGDYEGVSMRRESRRNHA